MTPAPRTPPPDLPADAPLSAEALAHFEQRLTEERTRALQEMGRFGETFGASGQEADGDLSSYSFHMADQGTDTNEMEKTYLLASRGGLLVWHIDEALRRLYGAPETFGRCEDCGRMIAYDRLDALPHVRFCIDCKHRGEDRPRAR